MLSVKTPSVFSLLFLGFLTLQEFDGKFPFESLYPLCLMMMLQLFVEGVLASCPHFLYVTEWNI